jgi:hypothetical protein
MRTTLQDLDGRTRDERESVFPKNGKIRKNKWAGM